MSFIVLTEEQTKIVVQATEPIEVRNPQGTIIARIPPSEEAEAVLKALRSRASSEPRYSGEKVQALLAKLTEIRKREGMDETKFQGRMAKFRAGELV